MDSAYIQANGIAQRYLAGSLSEDDSRAFEAACAADPALLEAFDVDFKLKAGLEQLAEQGQVNEAGSASAPQSARYLIAASIVAAVGLGFSAYLALRLQSEHRTTLQLRQAMAAQSAPRLLGSTVRILPLRGDSVDVQLPASGWIGLAMDATGLEGMSVTVELKRESGEVALTQAYRVPSDGTVFVVADPALLAPGNYIATITPQAGSPPAAIVYRLKVQPAER